MKTILRSFSIGLLTAAILIYVTIQFTDENKETIVEQKPFSIEDATELLQKEGFYVLNNEEWNELNQSDINKETSEEDSTSEEDEIAEQAKEEEKPDEENGSKSNDIIQEYTLKIEPGMTTIDVAEQLSKANIIEDRQAFEQFIINNNYGTAIQIGEFLVNNQMTYEEIAKIITKK